MKHTALALALLALCACAKHHAPTIRCVDATTGKPATVGYLYCWQGER